MEGKMASKRFERTVVIVLIILMTIVFIPASAYAGTDYPSNFGKFTTNIDENGVVTWTACPGATEYSLKTEGASLGIGFEENEARSYDLKKYIDELIKWDEEFKPSDTYHITITAEDNDGEVIDTCSFDFVYNSPCHPCYDNIEVNIDENGVASLTEFENLFTYQTLIYPGNTYYSFNESTIDLKSVIDSCISKGTVIPNDTYLFRLEAVDSEFNQLGTKEFSYNYESKAKFQNKLFEMNPTISDGILTWEGPDDVYYYDYGVCGSGYVETTNYKYVRLNEYIDNMIENDCLEEKDQCNVFIRAYNKDSEVISVWNTFYEYKYIEPEPDYVQANISSDNILTWTNYNKVQHYTVALSPRLYDQEYEIYEGEYLAEGIDLKATIDYLIKYKELYTDDYDEYGNKYVVYVRAVDNEGEELEPWEGEFYYKSNAKIKTIPITIGYSGKISWNPVEEADHYAIEYNFDRRFEVNGTTADTYEIFKSTGASAHAYYIKVLGMTEDGYRMAESESLTFTTLNNEILLLLEDNLQPSSIDGTLHYVPLNGVAYYTIYYNSESFRQRIELSDPPFNIDDYLDYLEKEKGVQFKTNDYIFIDAWDNEGRHIAEGFFKHSRHIHTEEIIQGVNPTCINTGLTEGIKCTTCGKILVEQEVIPALGHDYVDIPGTSIEATCTEPGKTAKMKCSRCGDVKDGEVTPALGHDWGEWTLTKAATCTEAGQESRTCSRDAEHMESREIPALGHTYVTSITPATLDEDGHIDEVCELCGDVRSTTAITHINTVKLSANSYVYNGSAKKPTVTVTDVDGEKLVKDVDYTVTYASGRKAIGKYKVTVNFTGSYAGSKVLTFTIKPPAVKGLKLTTPKSKQLKVSYSKANGGVSYQIWYRVKGTSTWKKTTATGTSKLLKSLKGGKTYQVKVRAYKKVSGTTHYGAWTAIKSIKVKK